ncbi:hypothetical protein GGQ84_003046 [Desulfitispora alkaliphila]|uniref:hypothetical protein n=1 Tax=Desulfitispora alkaliphila TaxID=622674 RepID=UPI003D194CF0
MEKKIKVLTWLVIVSIALNLYSFSRLNQMENNLSTHIDRSVYNNTHWLQSQVGSIQRSISEIQEDNKWIRSIDFRANENDSSPKKINMDVEWTFKEIEKEPNVLFQYREKGQGKDWTKIPAVQKGSTNFSASVILSPDKDYEYQLVSKGNLVKSEAITDIPGQYYKPVPLRKVGAGASSTGDGRKLMNYSANFAQVEPVLFDFYRIKDVKAIIITNGEQQTAVPVTESTHPYSTAHKREWILELPEELLDEDITQVILEVEYEDGTIQEKNFTYEIIESMAGMRR